MAREWNTELCEEIEINVDALTEACAARSKTLIFEDSYGSGVALLDGESIATYHELATRLGLDIARFVS